MTRTKAKSRPCGCPRTARPRAFTLTEILIALTLTAIMGACISMMIQGVAAGTKNQNDGRRHLTRIEALQSRLLTLVHSSRAILATGKGYLVYWTGDEAVGNPVDKAVDLSEMCLIQLDTTHNQLILYTKASGASDVSYATNTTWSTAAQTALKNNWYSSKVLANNVTVFNTTASNSIAANAREVLINITLADTNSTRNAYFAASVRAQAAPI